MRRSAGGSRVEVGISCACLNGKLLVATVSNFKRTKPPVPTGYQLRAIGGILQVIDDIADAESNAAVGLRSP